MTSFDRLREKQSDPATTAAPGFWETIARPPAAGIEQIEVSRLHNFAGHTFRVRKNDAFWMLVSSIRENGVQSPLLVRPHPTIPGDYELISGHRRHHAAQLAGLETMPVIVRDLDDDAATILMVDANLQREEILPSERAQAFKMKLEALKHQGERANATSRQVGEKSWSVTQVAKDANESERQVQRYIRLTELIPEIQEMVDTKQIAFNPAVELSYLKPEEQQDFIEAMDYGQATPSLSQAQRIKTLSRDGMCTLEAMCAVMSEEKKPEVDHVTLKNDVIRKYFPKSYTPQQMEQTIIKLLDQWQKKRERQQER